MGNEKPNKAPKSAPKLAQKPASTPGTFADTVSKAIIGGKKILDDLEKRIAKTKAENDKKVLDVFNINSRKYPLLTGTLKSKYPHQTTENLSQINAFVKDLETIMSESEDEESISCALGFVPKLPELNEQNIAKLLQNLSAKPSLKLINKNRDFIESYLANTGILDNDENILGTLLWKFPLQLLEKNKSELLDLARNYDKPILKSLLLNKIHDGEDLKFYLKNANKISSWCEKIEGKNPEVVQAIESLIMRSPAREILEKHLDDIIKITDRILVQHSKSDRKDPHAEAQYIIKTFSTLFTNLNNTGLIKRHGDLIFQAMGATFFNSEAGIYELVNIPYWFYLADEKNSKELSPHKEKIKLIFQKFAGRIDAKNIKEVLATMRNNLDEKGGWPKKWNELLPLLDNLMKNNSTLPDGSKYDISGELEDLLISSVYFFGGADGDHRAIITKITKLPAVARINTERINSGCLLHPQYLKIYEKFFEEHGDLPDKKDTKKYADYLVKLRNVEETILHLVSKGANVRDFGDDTSSLMEDYAGYMSAEDMMMGDFLNFVGPMKFVSHFRGEVGLDSKLVEEYLDKAKAVHLNKDALQKLRAEYLLKNYNKDAGDTDLRVFDYKKIDEYSHLFDRIRHQDPDGRVYLEALAIESIDTRKFVADCAKKPLYEVENLINSFSNSIDPNFAEKLFKVAVLPRISSQPIMGDSLIAWTSKNAKGERKIDVTQHNMKQIKQILRIFVEVFKLSDKPGEDKGRLQQIVVSNIKKVFPEFASTGNIKADIKWFFEKFDVEEINFKKMENFSDLIEFQQLISNFMQTDTKSAVVYLQNKFRDIDFDKISFENENYSIFKVEQIEKLRSVMNASSKVLGDMVVDMVGSSFLERNCCDYDSIPKLLKFAHAWENPGLHRDINGLYQLYSTYAFVEIASFIKENLEKDKSGKGKEMIKEKLEAAGMDYDDTIEELQAKGYLVITASNTKKFFSALTGDNAGYAIRKGASKVFGEKPVEFDGKKITTSESDWAKRPGVKVYSLAEGNKEIAKLIKCDPTKIKVKVLAEADAMVNMDAEAKNLGRGLIFSAPLTFSTGARKMTELAFRDGIQMNYLLSPYTKDGFLIVNQKGEQKVLNKKNMKIGDLISKEDLDAKDPQSQAIQAVLMKWAGTHKIKVKNLEELLSMAINPVQKFSDKNTFFELIRLKKYSLLGGMLLIDKQEGKDEIRVNEIKDGGDSRRLYLQFSDGQFGILNSTENMTTSQMVEIALQLGATKAIYMDTGMYDMASYQDGAGDSHVMGHQDTSESTNRVVIYE